MVEEPSTSESTATAENSTIPTIPDDDQLIIAVTSEEEKYLICDSPASRNNISNGSTEVQDFMTSAESLLTARIGSSLTVIGNGTIGLLGEVKVIPSNQLSKNIMSCGVMSRRGFSFFIQAYGGDCLIRFYLPDDDPEDFIAGYPLTTAKLVTNNLYICLLEVFKQSMNQLSHKANNREQRYNDHGLPRSLHQRTTINPDYSMSTTLSSADYFDAVDRLPDPTYGETSSEIVAMANSLTAEDRALVIYAPIEQPRFRAMPYEHHAPPVSAAIIAAYLSTLSLEIPIDYDLFLHDDEPLIQIPHYRYPHTNTSLIPFRLNNSPRTEALNQRIHHTMTTHADLISRVNCINPQHRSPALIRQIQLLEFQHEQYLRRIHDVEIQRRSEQNPKSP